MNDPETSDQPPHQQQQRSSLMPVLDDGRYDVLAASDPTTNSRLSRGAVQSYYLLTSYPLATRDLHDDYSSSISPHSTAITYTEAASFRHGTAFDIRSRFNTASWLFTALKKGPESRRQPSRRKLHSRREQPLMDILMYCSTLINIKKRHDYHRCFCFHVK